MTSKSPQASAGPLRGIRVVDLSNTFMVPYATLLLAQMGAEVIKVEAPEGDILRQVGDDSGTGAGPVFLNANRGKKSVTLDVREPADHERLVRLISNADVFVHNRPPSTARQMHIDYASVSHPRLIYAAAIGYGSGGPYEDLPAYDDIIQAASGFASVQTNAGEPQYVRTPVTDKATGLILAVAVLAALVERERSGVGQAIEVPMFESMISFLLLEQQGGAVFDPQRGPTGYARTNSVYRRPYRTADGLIGVMIYTDRQWRSFFELIERPELADDPRFATMRARTANTDALYSLLEQELSQRPTAEWLSLLRDRRLPATTVNSISDLMTDPHVEATGLIERSEHPSVGTVRSVRLPISFSRTPPPTPARAPLLGEHNGMMDQLTEDGMDK
jgi:crotonobetainyl-CoA:carnitine CoA-transferase CaiB-like acyl-CoA transferase